jgi:hypothetical protein
VGAGEGLLQAVLGDEAQLVEAGAEPPAEEDLVLDGLLELVLGDETAVPQDPGEYRHGAPSMKVVILVGYPSDRKALPPN